MRARASVCSSRPLIYSLSISRCILLYCIILNIYAYSDESVVAIYNVMRVWRADPRVLGSFKFKIRSRVGEPYAIG